MSAKKLKAGDLVEAGTPGTDDFDIGRVVEVSGPKVRVWWEIAGEHYWEYPEELRRRRVDPAVRAAALAWAEFAGAEVAQ